MTADDMQVGGDHYQRMAVQPWAAMESWMTREQFTGFLLGSAIAYLGRFNADAPGKGGIMDVKKARHCLDKLISVSESPESRTLQTTRTCPTCRNFPRLRLICQECLRCDAEMSMREPGE